MGAIAASALTLAAGIALAVVLTPIATRRVRKERWMVLLLGLGAVGMLLPAATIQVWTVMAAGVALGLSSQGVKICVDSLVQEWTADDVRGRAFSLYDMLFNVALVASAVTAALTLPADGASRPAFLAVGLLMAGIGLTYGRATTSTTYRAMRVPTG